MHLIWQVEQLAPENMQTLNCQLQTGNNCISNKKKNSNKKYWNNSNNNNKHNNN